MAVSIRAITEKDYDQWLPLWDGNNLDTRDDEVTTRTWARLNDQTSAVNGLVAEEDGSLIGLTHYILHPTTGAVEDVCYMQDVYVDPAHRKKGVARKMVEHLAVIGVKKGWARLYWLADEENAAAQELYKHIGVRLNFSLHILAF
jgi:ribosomal protein S18 acetylase RimI-like enzyme